jgi:hypothetical protein
MQQNETPRSRSGTRYKIAANLLKMPSFPAFRPTMPILEAQKPLDERSPRRDPDPRFPGRMPYPSLSRTRD